jgi:hypothetical protein
MGSLDILLADKPFRIREWFKTILHLSVTFLVDNVHNYLSDSNQEMIFFEANFCEIFKSQQQTSREQAGQHSTSSSYLIH